jgi:hypothetical protein
MNKSKEIVTVADLRDSLMRRFDLTSSLPFERISRALASSQRSAAIRRNYATFERRVELGIDDWNGSCPYEVADWLTVLSTPEFGAWQDIRSSGLPLWPRLPVGSFIVSFGNPEAKVALQCGIECDGIGANDPRADHWLKQTGWRVFRVSFERCLRVMDSPADVRERNGDVSDEYRATYLTETLAGTIQDLRHALLAAGVRL